MPLSNVGRAFIQIPLAVGAGLGAGILVQKNYLNELDDQFQSQQKLRHQQQQQQLQPQIDQKLIGELVNLNRKLGQLESELGRLKQVTYDQQQQQLHQQPTQGAQTSSINVFELSKVIEANDLASANRYQKEMEQRVVELAREHTTKLERAVSKTHKLYKPIVGKVRELEDHLETQQNIIRQEGPARVLWLACQGLFDKLKFNNSPEPLENDASFSLIRKFAYEDKNPLANIVIASIPQAALKEGVFSEEVLVDRFSKVEKICKRVALVNETGGGIANYFLSYLQSLFIFDNINVPQEELEGKQLVDPGSWTTFDILLRVKLCLAQHNLEQAVRYANQLKGQARIVARDWIKDARVHLETRQAIDVICSYARGITAKSVIY